MSTNVDESKCVTTRSQKELTSLSIRQNSPIKPPINTILNHIPSSTHINIFLTTLRSKDGIKFKSLIFSNYPYNSTIGQRCGGDAFFGLFVEFFLGEGTDTGYDSDVLGGGWTAWGGAGSRGVGGAWEGG